MAAAPNILKPGLTAQKLANIFAACFFLVSSVAVSAPLKTLTFSCVVSPQSSTASKILNRYNQAWNPLGYKIEFIYATPEQSIDMMRNGEVDGSCGRDQDFATIHNVSNMTSLTQPSVSSTIHALAKKGATINNDRSRLNVGYIPTFKRSSAEVKHMGYGKLSPFPTIKELLLALETSAVDLAVVPDVFLFPEERKMADQFTTHAVISSQSAYAQLDQRWHHLIAPFSRRLAVINAQVGYSLPAARVTRTDNHQQIVFNCPTNPQSQTFQVFKQLAEQAFQNIGYDFKLIYMPRMREQTELENGNIDGSCARSRHFVEHVSNNIRLIEIPMGRENIDVFSNDPKARVKSSSDFKEDMVIGFVKGSHTVNEQLGHLNNPLVEVPDIATGLKMLDSGKLDFFVDYTHTVHEYLDLLPLHHPVYTAGRLNSLMFFPVIHKKHAELIPKIQAELSRLIQEANQQSLINH